MTKQPMRDPDRDRDRWTETDGQRELERITPIVCKERNGEA